MRRPDLTSRYIRLKTQRVIYFISFYQGQSFLFETDTCGVVNLQQNLWHFAPFIKILNHTISVKYYVWFRESHPSFGRFYLYLETFLSGQVLASKRQSNVWVNTYHKFWFLDFYKFLFWSWILESSRLKFQDARTHLACRYLSIVLFVFGLPSMVWILYGQSSLISVFASQHIQIPQLS